MLFTAGTAASVRRNRVSIEDDTEIPKAMSAFNYAALMTHGKAVMDENLVKAVLLLPPKS